MPRVPVVLGESSDSRRSLPSLSGPVLCDGFVHSLMEPLNEKTRHRLLACVDHRGVVTRSRIRRGSRWVRAAALGVSKNSSRPGNRPQGWHWLCSADRHSPPFSVFPACAGPPKKQKPQEDSCGIVDTKSNCNLKRARRVHLPYQHPGTEGPTA